MYVININILQLLSLSVLLQYVLLRAYTTLCSVYFLQTYTVQVLLYHVNYVLERVIWHLNFSFHSLVSNFKAFKSPTSVVNNLLSWFYVIVQVSFLYKKPGVAIVLQNLISFLPLCCFTVIYLHHKWLNFFFWALLWTQIVSPRCALCHSSAEQQHQCVMKQHRSYYGCHGR